jgi:hypothetical protein
LSEKSDAESTTGKGFLAREHHKLRFTELGEAFFGRLILAKCPDPDATTAITVQLSLCDLFRRNTAEELTAALEGVTFSEAPKIVELTADVLSAILRLICRPRRLLSQALGYYQNHIASAAEMAAIR